MGIGEAQDSGDIGDDERCVEVDARRGADDHRSTIVGHAQSHRRRGQLQRRYDRRLGWSERHGTDAVRRRAQRDPEPSFAAQLICRV